MACVGGHQVGQDGVAAVDHAPQVDADDPVPVVQAVLREQPAAAHARVVHHLVHGAVGGDHGVGQREHGVAVGHVEPVHAHPGDERRDLGQSLGVHVDQRELAAFGGQGQGQGPSDAARGPCHHGRAALQGLHAPQATVSRQAGGGRIEVRPEALDAFLAALDQRHRGQVWQSGCQSWYLNDLGQDFTIWPGSTLGYLWRTRRVDPRDFLP